MRLTAFVAVLVFLLDQASKYWVVWRLQLVHLRNIEVFPPWLNFRMAWNQGMNFGLFADREEPMRWILITVALAISAWVWLWLRRAPHRAVLRISGGLLIGGAVGNVVDRLLYGAVADFLNMSCCGIENPFAFNVADVAIFAGAIGLVLFTGTDRPSRGGSGKTP